MLALLTDSPSQRQLLSPTLLRNGIFHYVSTLDQGLALCEGKEISGVVLDGVSDLLAATALCAALRRRYTEIPIAVLLDEQAIPDMQADCLIRVREDLPIDEVLHFCHGMLGCERMILSTRQLYITPDPDDTRYLGYPLRLSESEHRLLLCLTYLAPRVTSAKDLCRLCDPLALHSSKALAVRISAINQKAKEIHPRMLICNTFRRGYSLNNEVM